VQLLKWCREYGVQPMWNLLYGFPGENQSDYRTTLGVLQAITHLQPPMGAGWVRLQRFSPMFEKPEAFGIRHIESLKPYRFLYPFDESVLRNLAYFFDFDFDGKEKRDLWFAPIKPLMDRWQPHPGAYSLAAGYPAPGWLTVDDSRPTAVATRYRFCDPEKTIVEYCDEPRRFAELRDLLASLPAPAPPAECAADGDGETAAQSPEEAAERWLRRFLDYLTGHRLMVQSGDRYLSVILGLQPTSLPTGGTT
jgi:hypothetical protein